MPIFTRYENYPMVESSNRYVPNLRDHAEVVEIPYTSIGHYSDAIDESNHFTIESDDNLVGRLNLETMYGYWVAIIDGYTDEQFDELNDLIEQLRDYPILDESLWSETEQRMSLEALSLMRTDDQDDVSDDDVLYAIHELGLLFEHEGDGHYYISEEDLNAAVEYAAENQQAATV